MHDTAPFLSGHRPVDDYLERHYESVRGMSSRFSAAICAWCLGHQARNGIAGHVVEIGAFEGRFLIALALALEPGERALGIDVFEWPSPAVLDRFEGHVARLGLPPGRILPWKADSADLTPADIRRRLGAHGEGGPVRFFHIDGDHSPGPLAHDLSLAEAVLHPQGLICLDDMLHPAYPFLVTTVQRWLESHPDWRLMCVIDREDIVAAPKFLLCRLEAVPLYEGPLMERFAPFHFVIGGDALGHHCVVLTPRPRLAEVD